MQLLSSGFLPTNGDHPLRETAQGEEKRILHQEVRGLTGTPGLVNQGTVSGVETATAVIEHEAELEIS